MDKCDSFLDEDADHECHCVDNAGHLGDHECDCGETW